jgi:uncharacterized protein (DUF302 family)
MRYLAICALLSWLTVAQVLAGDMFLSAEKRTAYRAALDDLSVAILDHGYTPIKIQPIDQGLRRKGYESSDYKVIFFGNKAQVDRVLALYPEAAVMLPLKVILYQKGDVVIASAPRMDMWKAVFDKEPLNEIIDQWQNDLIAILHEFSSH